MGRVGLRALFTSALATGLTFEGGTSRSKAYKLTRPQKVDSSKLARSWLFGFY